MKKLTATLLLTLPFFSFRCEKDMPDKCLQVKIIRITCASMVMKALNDNSIGEDGWKDTFNGQQQVYDNVFSVSNSCQIASEYQAGDVLYATVSKKKKSDCVVCALYDAAPVASLHVNTIDRLPCGKDE